MSFALRTPAYGKEAHNLLSIFCCTNEEDHGFKSDIKQLLARR